LLHFFLLYMLILFFVVSSILSFVCLEIIIIHMGA